MSMDDKGRKLAVVAVIVGVFFLLATPLRAWSGTPARRVVRIEASQYQFKPGDIVVNRGDIVTIELVASDVVHGLYLDGYELQITADPGQTARLTFVADRAGVFRFRCAVACGAMHPFMIGKLRVGPNYLLWGSFALAWVVGAAGLAVAGRRAA